MNRKLDAPQNRPGRREEEKILYLIATRTPTPRYSTYVLGEGEWSALRLLPLQPLGDNQRVGPTAGLDAVGKKKKSLSRAENRARIYTTNNYGLILHVRLDYDLQSRQSYTPSSQFRKRTFFGLLSLQQSLSLP